MRIAIICINAINCSPIQDDSIREVLEAALIICIVIVATRGVMQRGKWMALGSAAG